MPRLTILALNFAAHDAAFDRIRALEMGNIEVVHAEYRSSWEEVSARRTGAVLDTLEVIADELRAALARARADAATGSSSPTRGDQINRPPSLSSSHNSRGERFD